MHNRSEEGRDKSTVRSGGMMANQSGATMIRAKRGRRLAEGEEVTRVWQRRQLSNGAFVFAAIFVIALMLIAGIAFGWIIV
jgi:hypothetical protein